MSDVAVLAPHARRVAMPRLQVLSRVAAPALLAVALTALVLVPYLVGWVGAPAGSTFRGALWPADDVSEYLAAVRQGAEGAWLWRDQYMVQTPPRVLMYPTDIAAGHLGSALGLGVRAAYVLSHVVGILALFGALWALGALYLDRRGRLWFVAFAFGTSGLYWLDALLAAAGHAPVGLSALDSPQLSGLTMALFDGHRALGIAGMVAAATGPLGASRAAGRAQRARFLAYGAAGMFLLLLTLSMLVPLLLAVLVLTAGAQMVRSRKVAPWRAALLRRWLYVAAIAGPSLPLVLYYTATFSHGPWAAPTMKRIYPPPAWEPVFVIGALLPLAWWGWRAAPASARPLADLLALWCCCAVLGRNLPFWQSIRMTDGISVAIGGLFALGLVRPAVPTARRRRWLLLAGSGAATHYLFLLSALAQGHAAPLYTTSQESAALQWLAGHSGPNDVVLSSYAVGNLIPEVATCRVVLGHVNQTLDSGARYPQVRAFFDPASSVADRVRVLRLTQATLVVYDPAHMQEGTFDPRHMPGLHAVFTAGDLAVLRVDLGRAMTTVPH